jgi:hypothetical protein
VKSRRVHDLSELVDNAERETVERLHWDFSSCPHDELDERHAYEFARHVGSARQDVARLRKGKQQTFDHLYAALMDVVFRSTTARRNALFWFYKPMDRASEIILALKPVTFHYKSDKTSRPQFGLIAEEVAEVNPDLVVRDENGEIYTVRYEAVNAMLLNEFLKEHRAVQEQQKEIDALKAELKEQRALIQKVNDKVELDKPARQTVLNN